MFKEIIKKKDYHGAAGVSMALDVAKAQYLLRVGNSMKDKPITFEYVRFKTIALTEWLRGQNQAVNVWYDNMLGTETGLRLYYEAIEAVETYCKLSGGTCEAMLNPVLIDYEGLQVNIVTIKGRKLSGTLERRGKGAILSHCLEYGGNSKRYIKPYEIQSVSLV